MKIHDSAAIVTGAASGLGAATAARLAEAGVKVFALDVVTPARKAGVDHGVEFLQTDVTSEADVIAALQTIADSGLPLRAAINCAGVGWAGRILSRKGPHDLERFRKVIDINLVGTFNVMRLAADLMQRQPVVDDDGQRGVIVNTASVAAFEGQVGQIAYAASKGALHAMTVCAARDLSQVGIRVCTIAPGVFDTPMVAGITPDFREALEASVPFPHRLGRPEEFAEMVEFIANHDYINGETIRLDGAIRLSPR